MREKQLMGIITSQEKVHEVLITCQKLIFSGTNKLAVLFSDTRMVRFGRYVCSKCGSDYKYEKTLKRHFRYECGVEPMFSCPHCQKKFKHNSNLKVHLIKGICQTVEYQAVIKRKQLTFSI
ncbi:hypothetical protein JTB14_010327 [Gonioctena quinquepunctata]|nr:hypothetical protein JTB14_010327 [Gonioctena quinquepunctata]